MSSGVRLQIIETDEGLVLAPIRRARPSARQAGWRSLRGCAKGTDALKQHLEEHRREAKRLRTGSSATSAQSNAS